MSAVVIFFYWIVNQGLFAGTLSSSFSVTGHSLGGYLACGSGNDQYLTSKGDDVDTIIDICTDDMADCCVRN